MLGVNREVVVEKLVCCTMAAMGLESACISLDLPPDTLREWIKGNKTLYDLIIAARCYSRSLWDAGNKLSDEELAYKRAKNLEIALDEMREFLGDDPYNTSEGEEETEKASESGEGEQRDVCLFFEDFADDDDDDDDDFEDEDEDEDEDDEDDEDDASDSIFNRDNPIFIDITINGNVYNIRR